MKALLALLLIATLGDAVLGSFGGAPLALSRPRALEVAPNGDLLTVETGAGRITALWEEPSTGAVQTATLVSNTGLGLNHHVKVYQGHIYASSDTTVYRWAYPDTKYRQNIGAETIFVSGMPAGGHNTRTLAFDAQGRIYISIGSVGNVDSDSRRSRVVRADPAGKTLPLRYPADFEIFADGLRNEVGLRFDPLGRLWGVENGLDNLGNSAETRSDFGSIYVTNPGEEVNLLREEDRSKHYGYPWCWSEGRGENGNSLAFSQGQGPGTQWATKTTDPLHTDAWCKNASNVVAPRYVMQAHTAPLDILFYTGTTFPGMSGKVAFVSKHGSWNRPSDIASGRSVTALLLDSNGFPSGEELILSGPTGWNVRPVGLAVASCAAYGECLYISDDSGGNIIAVAASNAVPASASPSPAAVATPVGINDPRTISLIPGLRFTYTLNANNTISIEIAASDARGWLASGLNGQPGMIGAKVVLASSTNIGRISVDSFDEAQLLSSWNNDSLVPWRISNQSFNVTGSSVVLKYTRTMDGININRPVAVTVAWNIVRAFNLDTKELPKHTSAGSYLVWLNNGTIVAPFQTDDVTPFRASQATALLPVWILALAAAASLLAFGSVNV